MSFITSKTNPFTPSGNIMIFTSAVDLTKDTEIFKFPLEKRHLYDNLSHIFYGLDAKPRSLVVPGLCVYLSAA